jgi:large subunit ribosomal protein L4
MEKKNRIVMPVRDMGNKVVEEIELDAHVFDGSVKKKTLYQAIVGYRANRRLGLAQTKTRGEISGGGKKPWKQKGTGRARHGSTRSPLWRHGGVVFGPHPRDFSYVLPQQIRHEALKSSLNAKIAAGDVVLVEKIHVLSPKTKEFVKFLDALKVSSTRILCVLESVTENIKRSARNIPGLRLLDAASLNAFDIMNSQKIIMSRDSLKNITKRLKHE